MICSSYNHFFSVIANETRLKIIESLIESPKNVGDICRDIEEEQSKVSHNLNILSRCNFVKMGKDGKKRVYSLNEKTIIPIFELVEKHVNMHCRNKCWASKNARNLS